MCISTDNIGMIQDPEIKTPPRGKKQLMSFRDIMGNILDSTQQTVVIRDIEADEVPEIFKGLDFIQAITFSHCKIKKINNLPDSVTKLQIIRTRVRKLSDIEIPPKLEDLFLSSTKLDGDIKFSNSHIKNFGLTNDTITSINLKNTNIVCLNLEKNCLTELCELPDTLEHLDANSNKITKVDLPPNIKECSLRGNELTEMPKIPPTMLKLDISSNNLYDKIIKELPDSIVDLSVSYSSIAGIAQLPKKLIRLTADSNKISECCPFPKTLTFIDLSNNAFIKFPDLPENVEEVIFDNNPVSNFPTLPKSCRKISVKGTNIRQSDVPFEILGNEGLQFIMDDEKYPKNSRLGWGATSLTNEDFTTTPKTPKQEHAKQGFPDVVDFLDYSQKHESEIFNEYVEFAKITPGKISFEEFKLMKEQSQLIASAMGKQENTTAPPNPSKRNENAIMYEDPYTGKIRMVSHYDNDDEPHEFSVTNENTNENYSVIEHCAKQCKTQIKKIPGRVSPPLPTGGGSSSTTPPESSSTPAKSPRSKTPPQRQVLIHMLSTTKDVIVI